VKLSKKFYGNAQKLDATIAVAIPMTALVLVYSNGVCISKIVPKALSIPAVCE